MFQMKQFFFFAILIDVDEILPEEKEIDPKSNRPSQKL